MGEVLHAIDFDQLQIENRQYLLKIKERNSELLKLKLTSGLTIQTFNSQKRELSTILSKSASLRADISQRQNLLSKLHAEESIVQGEKDEARKLNSYLVTQIATFTVPDVRIH